MIPCVIQTILIFTCPHCGGHIEVLSSETNCCIFRHGQFRSNGAQVNPHASKAECDKLIEEDAVFGCCKPFRLSITNCIWEINKCDYV